MKAINLKTKHVSADRLSQGSWGPLWVALAFLLIAGVTWLGLKYLVSQQKNKMIALEEEIENMKSFLNADQFREVYDFQKRLLIIDDILKQKGNQPALLQMIANATLGDTIIKTLDLSFQPENQLVAVKMDLFNSDLDHLAQQIDAYNGLDIEHNVILETSKQDKGGLASSLRFKMKVPKLLSESTSD